MEKFFSLEWFKERMESSVDRVLDERIGAKIDALIDQVGGGGEAPRGIEDEQIWKSIRLVNEGLTVVLKDGSILHKPSATEQDYERIKVCRTKQEMLNVILDKEVAKDKEAQTAEARKLTAIAEGFQKLGCLQDFEVYNDSIVLKGTSRTIPQLLLEKFTEVISKHDVESIIDLEEALLFDVEYQSLKKFFLKCCLNPNAQSAEDLYDFLAHHQFKIDKHGNFYAYRRVVSRRGTDDKLVQFISNAYSKVKAVWKKDPSVYRVVKCPNNEYCLEYTDAKSTDGEYVGGLVDLYLELPSMVQNSYTDAHTHSMDYRVGTSSSIPRDKGDDDNSISCSRGLHIASKAYDYSGFGDMPILAIINPMDVLAVPRGEVGKLRTCRWFFASTLTENERHILDDASFDVTELGDVFEEECLKGMQEYTQKSFAEEVKRHTFSIPSISAAEINSIVLSLEEMKKTITKRVSMIQ